MPENTGQQRSSDSSFASFGEFLLAVRNAEMPGGHRDPRLETRAASGLSESTPSQGGYLVAADYASGILKEAFETGQLAKLCRRIQISAGSNRIELNGVDETSRADGSRWGGIRAYWQDEASEKTKSAPKFRKIKLKLNKLIGLCYATDELLDDVTALEGVIRQGFASEFGFKIDDAIINGTGAGMPLGILNAGCLVVQAKETSQTADTIVYQNILKMWSRLPARSRRTAVWLINQDCEPQLAQMSVDGSGNSPVYLPPRGAVDEPYSTIFGRPVMPIEQASSIGDQGDIYLCDFSNYILAEKGGIQADMSIHVRSTKWAAHGSDAMINSSLIRGNLNRKARQSRASRDSNVWQHTESRASVETLQELPLAA
jgi:HK97 family phage major capsid protein